MLCASHNSCFLQGALKKPEPACINYVFAEIFILNNVIIIDNSLMNLTFLSHWDFILFVQCKSKQNKLKVLSYMDFVFNAHIIIYAGSVFLGHPVHPWFLSPSKRRQAPFRA